jgi:hypothetical protein
VGINQKGRPSPWRQILRYQGIIVSVSSSNRGNKVDCPCGRSHRHPANDCHLLAFALTGVKGAHLRQTPRKAKVDEITDRANQPKYSALVKEVKGYEEAQEVGAYGR